ncbi:FtsQ-type POTRA domain-containing protein [Candidatus Gracilibacteria bacterium]|nr:FtsQ-type POTRA domain-containing protein [Candidatus Gracilibacteria bacterium]
MRPSPRRALVQWLLNGKLFSLIICLASVGALAYLLTAERFIIADIRVEGNNALKAETVIELSQLNGVPIWYTDMVSSSELLLGSAYVQEATISTQLPNSATIRIVERKPEVRWLVNGVQYLVDSGGKVLAAATEPAEPDVLVITASGTVLEPNDLIDTDALKLTRALALRLPAELSLQPKIIGWDYGLGVYVKTAEQQTIVFGRSESLERKMAVLGYLLKEQTAFTYLDLRPSNPYYQNKQAGATP